MPYNELFNIINTRWQDNTKKSEMQGFRGNNYKHGS